MKVYILSLLAFGSLFSSDLSINPPIESTHAIKSLDPTRELFSITADPYIMAFDTHYVPIPLCDFTASLRSKIHTGMRGYVGRAHRFTLSFHPCANVLYSECQTWENPPKVPPQIYSATYQYLTYLNPKGRIAIYYGGGMTLSSITIYHWSHRNPKPVMDTFHPSATFSLGTEIFRTCTFPILLESALSVTRYSYEVDENRFKTRYTLAYFPRLRCGICF